MRKKPPPRPKPEIPSHKLSRLQLVDVLRQLDADSPKCTESEVAYQLMMISGNQLLTDVRAGRVVFLSRALLRRILGELAA